MWVPSVSQLVNGSGGDRCGEACMTAAMLRLGHPTTMAEVCAALGKPFNNATSTFADLERYAARFPDVQQGALMTQASCQSAVAFSVVILLVDNAKLSPTPYPVGAGWRGMHWIIWMEDHGGLQEIMDPLAYPGHHDCEVTTASLIAAIEASPTPQWGISLRHHPTPTGPKPSPVGPLTARIGAAHAP